MAGFGIAYKKIISPRKTRRARRRKKIFPQRRQDANFGDLLQKPFFYWRLCALARVLFLYALGVLV
jgi:hypothetical protein